LAQHYSQKYLSCKNAPSDKFQQSRMNTSHRPIQNLFCVEDVEDAWRKCGGYFFGLSLINKVEEVEDILYIYYKKIN